MKLRCSAAALWLATLLACPAQGFQASAYGNVTLHLRAADLGLPNSSPVSKWGPLIAAGTAQPTFLAADIPFNSQPTVRFDGLNDLLTQSAADLNAQTIFAVLTSESASLSLSTLLSNGGDGLNIRRHDLAAAYRSPTQAQDDNDFTGNGLPVGSLIVNKGPGSTFTQGSPHLLVASAGTRKNFSSLWLGNASPSLNRFWKGRVAEILVYDGPLSPANRNAVGYYLQAKYKLPTTFTAPDPLARFSATTASGVSSEGGVLSPAGGDVALQWTVSQAETVSIEPAVLPSGPTFSGSALVHPDATTTYTLTATNALGVSTTQVLTVHVGLTPLPPQINEFLADNESSLIDPDGSTPDWIELFNPNPYGIDLAGWQLRDRDAQWDFPPGSGIPANGYRLVRASGRNLRDPAAPLHANFTLDNAGEPLSLVRPATGEISTSFLPAYPAQFPDISFGTAATPAPPAYFGAPFGSPSPGAPNNTSALGFLDLTDDTKFSVGRGFYREAVTTTLSARTPGATLVYTTNGSEPTLANGTKVPPLDPASPPSVTLTIHPGAVPVGAPGINLPSVGGVTTLRAAAFLAGYAPTNTDTQTYLFSSQVLAQTPANAVTRGWPSAAVNGQLFNFGMDPAVVSSFTAPEMLESLYALPTLSIVTDQKNLTNSTTGIYVNADQHGPAWERPISLELIHPPGYVSPDGNLEGFQINAGLRMRGGYSRNDSFFKHGLRLFFSSKYDGKLRYPLFGKTGTDQFGKLDLGTGSNYGWYRESSYASGKFNTMVRDPFCRDTLGALGQPTTRSRYYHLYLNGHYWGLYYSEERAEAEYAASYFGGSSEEYDAVKCGNHIGGFATEATDGSLDAWRSLWTKARSLATSGATLAKYFEISGRNPDGSRNPALPVLLDIDNLIDEMLVIFYAGDGDAVLSNFLGHDRPNNWFSVYRRNGADGFRFFIRDAEHTLGTPSWVVDQTGPWGGSYVNDFTYSNPQRLHQDLMASPEYKLRFADHVRRHFFDGGALTPAATAARFQARADLLTKAVRVESARWGDAQALTDLPAGHAPRYLASDWLSAVNTVKTTVLPTRTAAVLAQLKVDGLYPALAALAAPNFLDSTGQPTYQTSFPGPATIRLQAASPLIAYTLDGSEPRLPGGALAPTALTAPSPLDLPFTRSTTLQARAYNPTTSAWSALTRSQYLIGTLASAANLVISQIHYHPATPTGQEEFLELLNISPNPIDLTRCRFTAGISFAFPDGTTLAPGARALLLRNPAAFATAYPLVPPSAILGAFTDSSALSNSGETIELLAADGLPIKQFAYRTLPPWPAEADGTGPALVLISPTTNPDPSLPESWRRSSSLPTPASSDALLYPAWAQSFLLADPDGSLDSDRDGFPNLVEYALGSAPLAPTPADLRPARQPLPEDPSGQAFLTLTVNYPPGRDDAVLSAEASSDLAPAWLPALPVGPPVTQPDGSFTRQFRHPQPATAARQFLRLKATRVP